MKAIRYTLIVTALAGLGLLVALHARGGGAEELPAPEAAASAPARPEPPAPAPALPARATAAQATPPLLPPGELAEDEVVHGEFTTNTDVLKQKIFKKAPRLAQFDFFREHVLLDSASKEDFRKLLADPEMLEQTRRELLLPTDAQDSMESNVKRLLQVDYLREALRWKEHPQREHLFSVVESIILEDTFHAAMPADVKRSVAASKMELFEIFYDHAPERATALVEAARGGRLEKLLQYIAQQNQNRLKKERELSLQAQRRSHTP